jgi:hypothetical protein
MSWASFHCVEVMSQPKLALKHAGYLAVQQVREPAEPPPPRVSKPRHSSRGLQRLLCL